MTSNSFEKCGKAWGKNKEGLSKKGVILADPLPPPANAKTFCKFKN